MTATYKILGITDERCECECCGKTNLKCTVALENTDGDITYFGRDCAAKAMRGNNKRSTVAIIETEARDVVYATKWLRHTEKHTSLIVRRGIRGVCEWAGEFALRFPSGTVVAK